MKTIARGSGKEFAEKPFCKNNLAKKNHVYRGRT